MADRTGKYGFMRSDKLQEKCCLNCRYCTESIRCTVNLVNMSVVEAMFSRCDVWNRWKKRRKYEQR